LSDETTHPPVDRVAGRGAVLSRADTPGCTAGMRLPRSMPVIETGNATVLGLSPDRRRLAKWRRRSCPYNLLSDPDHAMADAFGAWGEKSMYGKTYEGILRGHAIIRGGWARRICACASSPMRACRRRRFLDQQLRIAMRAIRFHHFGPPP
jgi:hypothetical protein